MASAVRRPGDLAVRGHRDEGHLATAGRVDQLEGHLDPVGVGLVQDELDIALEGVISVQGAGIGGIRDLLHADDHVESHGSESSTGLASLVELRLGLEGVRVLLIVNAFASSVTARSMVVIRKAFSADHDVELVETTRRGHAARLARGAANEGVDVVVVMGGDGTLNEAANGLVGTDTALAVLPGGSTNVFARTIGLPNDPVEATGVLLRRAGQGLDPPGRPRRGQRPLLPVPHRRSASTPPWSSRSSGGRR